MSEFTVQSESVDVEQIMEQIRQRIRSKRDEDYTEEQIRELAKVKLERFLDPQNIRSDMVTYYRRRLKEREAALRDTPDVPTSYDFDPEIVFRSSRGIVGRLLYWVRRLSSPIVKIFFNPAPILHALTVQQEINKRQAEAISQMVRTHTEFIEIAALNYEVMHNLVVEMTRLSIEMKNHRMRVESIAGRLDFDERRARSLETVVQYREGGDSAAPPPGSSARPEEGAGPGRRRRRRRGRRRPAGGSDTSASSTETAGDAPATEATRSAAEPEATSSESPTSTAASQGSDASAPHERTDASPTGDREDPTER